MSQKTRNNAIRAENRKALPKFFAFILTAAVVGFFAGFLIAYFGDTSADFFLAMLNGVLAAGAALLPCPSHGPVRHSVDCPAHHRPQKSE